MSRSVSRAPGRDEAFNDQPAIGHVNHTYAETNLSNERRYPNLSQRRPLQPHVRRCHDQLFDSSIAAEKEVQAKARPKPSLYQKPDEDRYTTPRSVSRAPVKDEAFNRRTALYQKPVEDRYTTPRSVSRTSGTDKTSTFRNKQYDSIAAEKEVQNQAKSRSLNYHVPVEDRYYTMPYPFSRAPGTDEAFDGRPAFGLVNHTYGEERMYPSYERPHSHLSQRRPPPPPARHCPDKSFDSIAAEKKVQAQATPKPSLYQKPDENRYTMPHSVSEASAASGAEAAFRFYPSSPSTPPHPLISTHERHQNESDKSGCALIKTRRQTIVRLYGLADEIDKISKHSKIALVTGTVVSILGAIVGVPLGILAIVFTGGAAALPIAAGVAGGVGAAGGVTSFGADRGGRVRIKSKHRQAVDAVEADRKLGQKFLDYIKTTNGEQQRLDGSTLAKGTLSAVGGVASAVEKSARIAGTVIRAGDATLDAVGVAAKVVKVAGVVSIGVNVIILPLDIYILVKNAKDIYRATKHEKAEEIRGWAKDLETSLPNLIKFASELNKVR